MGTNYQQASHIVHITGRFKNMMPVATEKKNSGVSPALPEVHDAVRGGFTTLQGVSLTDQAVSLGVAIGFVITSTSLLFVFRATFAYPIHLLIGVAFAFIVARTWGSLAGNLYVGGLLCVLHGFHFVAVTQSLAAIAQYCEAVVLSFGAVGVGSWMRKLSEKVTFYQRERDVWSSVIGAVEKRQRRFLREVLSTVTNGSLILCDVQGELPTPLPFAPGEAAIPLQSATLSDVRARVRDAAKHARISPDATGDLVIAASEAALNAVVHGQGGDAEIRATENGRLQIWVRDNGSGIDDALLHRATLEAGFSSKGTLGQGFALMVSTCERVYLSTGSTGTTLVLQNYAE